MSLLRALRARIAPRPDPVIAEELRIQWPAIGHRVLAYARRHTVSPEAAEDTSGR
jgi:hypothetical protein